MFSAGLFLLGLTVSSVVGATQKPFFASRPNPAVEPYDAGLFSPMEDLSLLSTEFTTLEHPFFPNYNVRIKKSDFCDGTVR